MKKLSEFIPQTYNILRGASEEEKEKFRQWKNKYLEGFKQTWDYNSDAGVKEIMEKGKEIRLITKVYGHTTIYKITNEELKAETEGNKWERR